MQKTFHSFIKNEKERKYIAFFWKERVPNPAFSLIKLLQYNSGPKHTLNIITRHYKLLLDIISCS